MIEWERLEISSRKLETPREHFRQEWERLEISSRKLEIPREHFRQRWVQEKIEMVWT